MDDGRAGHARDRCREGAYHPFDLTKVWPHVDYPLIEAGEFELNKNPENFFSDVEQSAFSSGNLVSGISVSPEKMLQARLFNYPDAQRYRLGANYQQIPVNRARYPVASNHRDGSGRTDAGAGFDESAGVQKGRPDERRGIIPKARVAASSARRANSATG